MDEEALKKLVGNKIKELRSIKHWSRPQVSGKLKMSENNYGCIERGEIDVSLVRLAQLAKIFSNSINIFGISIPELVDSNTNEKNVFNLTGKGKNNENFRNCTIGKSEIETLALEHELEKAVLLLQERDKEIEHLKKQLIQSEQINQLLKGEK